ncbi:helix-turn-helix domain-containing protein [Mycolicibacterium gilvum]|uniref:Uncharacterized protein n=1 Tax=Mycolicibacterium gilvum TaxID=1804 RepID=A0A378SIW9_9MYCO|nr:helix-turn-helix domain-containing protein [Mycolicibacterium gilvum]MCV7057753.1 hypothetical protein [Mycolicibacterium gilvum]STZ42571.1 Uncharacterised protein [Mycolicibacterium gilvum]
MSNPSRNKPDADERQRALKAVELRVQGHTYARIAAALDYSDESGARHAVSRLLARREAESIDELRAVHGARLEGVLSSFWLAATTGDTHAARIVLRTLDSLAKLHGLDAPTRVAVGPQISEREFAEEAARLIESIASMGATDDLLRSLPDGAGHAVLDARKSAALPGDKNDDEEWSNIGGPDPVPVASMVAVPQPFAAPEPLTVVDAEPQVVAEVEPQAESEVTPQQVPSPRRFNPWTFRINDRYDPLAGWRR